MNHESLKDQAISAEKSISDFLSETKTAFALNNTKSIEEFSLGIEIEDKTAVVSVYLRLLPFSYHNSLTDIFFFLH